MSRCCAMKPSRPNNSLTLLAKLDPTSFQAALTQAQATGNDALIAEALFGAAKAAALDSRRADAVRLGYASLALFEQMHNHTRTEVERWLRELADNDEATKSPGE